MKNLRKYILIACSLFTLAACDLEIDITNPGLITEEKPDRPQAGETITYRAQVWVEKNDMEELYGGERLNPEKPDVPLNKNDAFQKVQKRRVQEKR